MPDTPSMPAQPSPDQATPLPSPRTFDILPALHELLSRLDHGLPASEEVDGHYPDPAPLEPKDVPTQALPIKARIRKALRELEKLPDMDRTVQEQQEEIEELEIRIRKQKQVLRGLGGIVREGRAEVGG